MDEGYSIWRDYCKMGFKNSEGFEQAEKNSKTILKNMNPRKKWTEWSIWIGNYFLVGRMTLTGYY